MLTTDNRATKTPCQQGALADIRSLGEWRQAQPMAASEVPTYLGRYMVGNSTGGSSRQRTGLRYRPSTGPEPAQRAKGICHGPTFVCMRESFLPFPVLGSWVDVQSRPSICANSSSPAPALTSWPHKETPRDHFRLLRFRFVHVTQHRMLHILQFAFSNREQKLPRLAAGGRETS